MATLRSQLISQLRQALGELEKPTNDDDCTVVFDISDTTFEYDVEQLDEEIPNV